MPLSHPDHPQDQRRADVAVNPVFTREPVAIPRDRLPDGELDNDTAYQVVHDELMLGWDIPVHVYGASGAMIAPSATRTWHGISAARVASINTSGHKYGLVYPGVGRAVWRDADALPEDLVFRVNYLGGEMHLCAQFSRPGAQYYSFLCLGRDGYGRIQQYCRDVATDLARRIDGLGAFRLITDGSQLPRLRLYPGQTAARPRGRVLLPRRRSSPTRQHHPVKRLSPVRRGPAR